MKLGVLADVISCLKTLSFGTPTPGKHSPEKKQFFDRKFDLGDVAAEPQSLA